MVKRPLNERSFYWVQLPETTVSANTVSATVSFTAATETRYSVGNRVESEGSDQGNGYDYNWSIYWDGVDVCLNATASSGNGASFSCTFGGYIYKSGKHMYAWENGPYDGGDWWEVIRTPK